MQIVDYDDVAATYDRRYDRNNYDGVRVCLSHFIAGAADGTALEVGCGTGHWLAELAAGRLSLLAGLDRAAGMLARARWAAPDALLVQGTASHLPLADESFDRVFCVNALHHFPDPVVCFAEAYRVLRHGGAFLTIGLDPHAGGDTWWVYDYFPPARRADERRYRPTAELRDALTAAGFSAAVTHIAQHLPGEVSFEQAQASGRLDRQSTSQLMVIPDDAYAAGIARIEAERPILRADLRLYATSAVKKGGQSR